MEVAELGAPGNKKVTCSLLSHKYFLLLFFVVRLPWV